MRRHFVQGSLEFFSPSVKRRALGSRFFPVPGARFSKVPKLYAPFSGVTIPSVSQERREIKSSNFTVSLLFVTLKTCFRIGVPERGVGRFANGLSGLSSTGSSVG